MEIGDKFMELVEEIYYQIKKLEEKYGTNQPEQDKTIKSIVVEELYKKAEEVLKILEGKA